MLTWSETAVTDSMDVPSPFGATGYQTMNSLAHDLLDLHGRDDARGFGNVVSAATATNLATSCKNREGMLGSRTRLNSTSMPENSSFGDLVVAKRWSTG